MKTILAALVAATAIGAAAPAAMAQPYGYGPPPAGPYWRHHHHWHRGFYGPGPGWRGGHWRHRAWCYHHPYAC